MKPEATTVNARTIQYHLWIVIASLAFTLLFEFFTKRAFFSHLFVSIFVLLLAQMELFIWLGRRMFGHLTYFTVKEFVNRILLQLLKFYLLVLLISFLLFVTIGVVSSLLHDYNPFEFIRSIPRNELKGFGIGSGIGLLCGSIFFFTTQLIHAINRVQRLHEEKLAYQYQTLKNQVDPHFLFNSLNSVFKKTTRFFRKVYIIICNRLVFSVTATKFFSLLIGCRNFRHRKLGFRCNFLVSRHNSPFHV